MSLSRQSIGALVDLVENKLSCMTVADRDDLRERVNLQRALMELSGMAGLSPGSDDMPMGFVPRRGRRRRIMTENFV